MAIKIRHDVLGFLILAIVLKKISTNEIDDEILQVDKEIDNEFGDFFKNKRLVKLSQFFYEIGGI